ncbi:hypothetical protein CRM93_00250 [Acetobacter fabarum]|uniref:Uncharacterized protein n=1 Tax=Acetobacter fabarum TaxID=483199 RepID=A0A269Y217_9PROT|nr:hypothetical protein B8X00_02000 [Acetobacter fabarum]PEN28569.1 hypothetical protein CRM93_00250 [Acetobacter fabarum]
MMLSMKIASGLERSIQAYIGYNARKSKDQSRPAQLRPSIRRMEASTSTADSKNGGTKDRMRKAERLAIQASGKARKYR